MREIAGLRCDDMRAFAARQIDELIGLMAADIGQDPAVARRVPEPVGPGCRGQSMRGKIDRLDHAPDRAVMDKLARHDRRGHFEPFGIHDRKFAAGLLDRTANVGKLLQRGNRRLVAEIILARAHDADAQRGSKPRDGRAADQLDRGIAQNLVFRTRQRDIAISRAEHRNLLGIARMEGGENAASPDHGVGDAIDMIMIEPDHRERHAIFRLGRRACGRALGRRIAARRGLRQRIGREARDQPRGEAKPQKIAPVGIGHGLFLFQIATSDVGQAKI